MTLINADPKPIDVAVIGAGMSGLYMASRLAEHGITYTVFEKADEVGGTWRENRYPGLYVDVPTSKFHLHFAPKFDWTHAFAPGPEIQQYLVDVADTFDFRRNIRFGVRITDAEWVDGTWQLQTDSGQQIHAKAVVFATGFLHVPTIPPIPGRGSFEGPEFHSSEWPDGLEIEGKRIGIVGSGSSGIQLVAELAYRDCSVTQFVRHPQWIETCENPESTPEWRESVRNSDHGAEDLAKFEEGIEQDPRLQDPYWKIVPGELREGAVQALREDILAIRDPELRAALTPDWEPGCKRVPKSPNYYKAVQEPSVRIVRAGVTDVDATGVTDGNGVHHDLDIIIWATGFDTHAYMRPITVRGKDGITLDDAWANGPFSYRGVSVPEFPNMFMLHGPYSPVNNVAVPTTLSDETTYVATLLDRILSEHLALTPSPEATERFLAEMRAAIPQTVWAGDCENWYRVGNAGLPVIWPWYEKEHAALMSDIAESDLLSEALVSRDNTEASHV